jgi:addiction module HigA family antidote
MKKKMLNNRKRRPAHPGAMLREVVLPEIDMSQGEFAAVLGVSRRTINELLQERRPVTVDTAHRLARALDTSPEVWLRMQQAVEVWEALQRHQHHYEKIKAIRPKRAA